ncbi:hypothetical protein QTN25_001840 [Entamoeba marina]
MKVDVLDYIKYQIPLNKDLKEFKFLLKFERNHYNLSYIDASIEDIAGITHDERVRKYTFDNMNKHYYNVMKSEENISKKILIFNKLENTVSVRDPEKDELTFGKFTITDLAEDEGLTKLLQK